MTTEPGSRLRLGALLWAAGMLGVVVLSVSLLPGMLEGEDLPFPLWAVVLLSVAQSGVFLALAVWAGVALTPPLGLDAPALRAAAAARAVWHDLRPQLAPGLIGGLLGGAALFTAWRYPPAILAEVPAGFGLPLYARVLYGGITEELLLRWGVMSALLWLAWRFLQGRRGAPAPAYVWLAIAMSALLFGLGHLPATAAAVGELNAVAVLWVVGLNSAFGLLFGWLYWRHGLESAMIAHALAHVVSYAA